MASTNRVGVYFCHAGTGRLDGLDLAAVLEHARQLPEVAVAEDLGHRPSLDPGRLAEQITGGQISDIVIAGDSPGHFKPVFTRAMVLAGGDPERVRLASFGESVAGAPEPDAAAKAAVVAAVFGVPLGLAAPPGRAPVNPDTLVIGGGVAGIETALRIADAGYQVHLVERTATIGGHMAMFDKTFPTLDCAACILTPKMVAVGQHENIDILNCAEVQSVSGTPGDYRVRVLRRARRVDPDACIACHACRDVCPTRVPSEFDEGIVDRKAIYMAFPQAIPNSYVVDGEHCTWVQDRGPEVRRLREEVSQGRHPPGRGTAHHRADGGQHRRGHRASITFDAARIERYGYGKLPNVLTALEFERLTNASGPTGGKIVTRSPRVNKRTKQEEWVFEPEASAAAERGHHPLRGLARRQLQQPLLAGLLHVLAQVRPPGEGEAARRRLLPVLHRHARLRKGLRGVLRAHQGRGRVRGARPHRPGRRARRAAW